MFKINVGHTGTVAKNSINPVTEMKIPCKSIICTLFGALSVLNASPFESRPMSPGSPGMADSIPDMKEALAAPTLPADSLMPTPQVAQAYRKGDYKVGLVLSGGGAKGIAHIGVIKALEENGIPVGIIVYSYRQSF